MKALFTITILAAAVMGTIVPIGCTQSAVVYYRSSASSDHFSSFTHTRFGTLHVWSSGYPNSGDDLGFVTASDVISDTGTGGPKSLKYLACVPQSTLAESWRNDTTLSSFDLSHAISLLDSDARALLSALDMIAHSPQSDSSYFHYSCETQLNVAPSSVNPNFRYFPQVRTGTIPIETRLTTCELTFYLDTGTVTLADGTVWTKSLPLGRNDIVSMDSVLKSAVTDLEKQK